MKGWSFMDRPGLIDLALSYNAYVRHEALLSFTLGFNCNREGVLITAILQY